MTKIQLDGTIPTLDASELSYEFEKARIAGAGDIDVKKIYSETDKKVMPESFTYVDSFRDPYTGTSAVAFKDKSTEKVIIAYTGTNPNSDLINDAILTDGVSIGLGTGHHYDVAYEFYEKILKDNGLSAKDVILTGHSLGGNIAQRVALRFNVPTTVVYNAAPLYIPATKEIGNALLQHPMYRFVTETNVAKIEMDRANFTGKITRITTEKDPLNNVSDFLEAVYVGEEYVIPNSGGHLMPDLRAASKSIEIIEQATLDLDGIEKETQASMDQVRKLKERFKVNDIGSGAPNGLSAEELIALDIEQAKAISKGLSKVANSTMTLVKSRETATIDKAEDLYETLDDVPVGFIMSADEVKATYQEFGVHYQSIVERVKNHCQEVHNKAHSTAQEFIELNAQIESGVEQLRAKDQEIGRVMAHG